MNVLSLFDGISVGRAALDGVGVEPTVYYASEIDKYAEQISESNWSDVTRLGSVCDYPMWKHFKGVDGIDLLMAGSPCQGFSFAGKQLAFDDPRSKLYFDFVECIKEFKPRYVLLENVVMKAEFQDVISRTMQEALDSYGGGVLHKTQINSALVCAQNRKRIYWTNWPVTQPEDRGILLRDILLDERSDTSTLEVDASRYESLLDGELTRSCAIRGRYNGDGSTSQQLEIGEEGKSNALTTVGKDSLLAIPPRIRKLHPIECERLQGLEDNYTLVLDGDKQTVSNTQRYKALGNGWQKDTIEHILRCNTALIQEHTDV